jgi:hypothetical protein
MLIIRHRTGALAGQGQTVEEPSDRVTFGRDPDACDVVFPPDETLISRRHFALERKPSGEWTLDLFGEPFVAVNGTPAEYARAIRTGDVITLGRPGGPSFEVVIGTKRFGGQLAATVAQARMPGLREATRGARRLALAGMIAAFLAAGAAGTFWYLLRSDAAQLGLAMASLTDAQTKAAADSIGPATREKVLQASYLVFGRAADGEDSALGTASPIANNILATNAHVVEAAMKGRYSKILVRAPGREGKVYEVTGSSIHPGYTAFQGFLRAETIFVPTTGSPLRGRLAYDVGILRVAENADLSPVLELASQSALEALGPGTPLVMAGYPLERISGREVQAVAATPTLSVGMVTAMTDMFSLPAEPARRRLVQHNLPGVGGNSGSPMLTPDGKLVALHNAGSYIEVPNVGRVPNAAMVRFAQRVDFLREVVENRAHGLMASERAYWEQQTAAFKRGLDGLALWVLSVSRPEKSRGASPTLAGRSEHTLTDSARFREKDRNGKETVRRQQVHQVTLKAGRQSTFIAYGQNQASLELYLVVGGDIVRQHDRGAWYPHFSYTPTADAAASIYVVDPRDRDVKYTLLEYVWEEPRS